jgi:hypothetical protein
MTIGVKYVAYANSSGYGLSALAYVRALHNIGVPVWWQPSFLGGPVDRIWRPEQGMAALPLAHAGTGDASLSDLPMLARQLCRPIAYDTVIMHTVPEHWPRIAECRRQNIGYTTWETNALPDHWTPLLALPDKVFVPSTSNGKLFARGASGKPVHVVPHIRRHAWNTPTPEEKIALRRKLGIPGDYFLFYTIGVWDPRKALGDLVGVFARQFSARDKVTLLIKTSAAPSSFAAGAWPDASIATLVHDEIDKSRADTGIPAAPIALIAADDISGRTVDVMHAIGDCFVSLTHGEGWGSGTYDAATQLRIRSGRGTAAGSRAGRPAAFAVQRDNPQPPGRALCSALAGRDAPPLRRQLGPPLDPSGRAAMERDARSAPCRAATVLLSARFHARRVAYAARRLRSGLHRRVQHASVGASVVG